MHTCINTPIKYRYLKARAIKFWLPWQHLGSDPQHWIVGYVLSGLELCLLILPQLSVCLFLLGVSFSSCCFTEYVRVQVCTRRGVCVVDRSSIGPLVLWVKVETDYCRAQRRHSDTEASIVYTVMETQWWNTHPCAYHVAHISCQWRVSVDASVSCVACVSRHQSRCHSQRAKRP